MYQGPGSLIAQGGTERLAPRMNREPRAGRKSIGQAVEQSNARGLTLIREKP